MIQSNFQSNTLTPQFRHLWTLCIIRYTQIQSEIPIPRLTIISKSKNETTRGNWTNPISNQIFLNICMTLDIFQSNSKYQYFGLPSYQYLGMIKTKIDFKSNRYIWANPIPNPNTQAYYLINIWHKTNEMAELNFKSVRFMYHFQYF